MIDLPDFDNLARTCAPMVAIETLRGIARTESAYRPHALSINYPLRTASKDGRPGRYAFLTRQPKDTGEAIQWAKDLIAGGYTVSIGLVQINSEHLSNLGATVEQAFDPCVNLRLGAALFTEKYRTAVKRLGSGQAALDEALSTYNSGSTVMGFQNGYVQSVRSNMASAASDPAVRMAPTNRTPALPSVPVTPANQGAFANPYSAPSQVVWDPPR